MPQKGVVKNASIFYNPFFPSISADTADRKTAARLCLKNFLPNGADFLLLHFPFTDIDQKSRLLQYLIILPGDIRTGVVMGSAQ